MLDEMSKRRVIDTFGLGFGLWLIGYVLGMIFFTLMDVRSIGLFVLLFLIPIAVYSAMKRFRETKENLPYFVLVGISWLAVAVVLDYFLLVKAFNVKDYYDLDVVIYYSLMFLIPVFVGVGKRK